MNIYQRINEVRKKIGYVQKDKSVSAGSAGSYKAVTHDAVTGMVRNALIECGVVIVPSVLSSVFNQKEPEAKQRLYEATYQIDFVNIEQPDDRVSMQVSAHALDNGDKAPGKAMSYATKYAMLKMFNIETGEDEESRYQTEDFDPNPHVAAILDCKDLNSLQETYKVAYQLAAASKSKESMQIIVQDKDKAKTALTKKEAA